MSKVHWNSLWHWKISLFQPAGYMDSPAELQGCRKATLLLAWVLRTSWWTEIGLGIGDLSRPKLTNFGFGQYFQTVVFSFQKYCTFMTLLFCSMLLPSLPVNCKLHWRGGCLIYCSMLGIETESRIHVQVFIYAIVVEWMIAFMIALEFHPTFCICLPIFHSILLTKT